MNKEKQAKIIKDNIAKEIFASKNRRPSVAILTMDKQHDYSVLEKEAQSVGIETHIYRLDNDMATEQVIETINFLNNDPSIDAVSVQGKFPNDFNKERILETVAEDKNIDLLVNYSLAEPMLSAIFFEKVLELYKNNN